MGPGVRREDDGAGARLASPSSLRAKRSNPALPHEESWIASSLTLLGMTASSSLPRVRHLLDPPGQHGPIAGRPEPLQQIHESRIAADQDARLVLLDPQNDPLRRRRRRRL